MIQLIPLFHFDYKNCFTTFNFGWKNKLFLFRFCIFSSRNERKKKQIHRNLKLRIHPYKMYKTKIVFYVEIWKFRGQKMKQTEATNKIKKKNKIKLTKLCKFSNQIRICSKSVVTFTVHCVHLSRFVPKIYSIIIVFIRIYFVYTYFAMYSYIVYLNQWLCFSKWTFSHQNNMHVAVHFVNEWNHFSFDFITTFNARMK